MENLKLRHREEVQLEKKFEDDLHDNNQQFIEALENLYTEEENSQLEDEQAHTSCLETMTYEYLSRAVKRQREYEQRADVLRSERDKRNLDLKECYQSKLEALLLSENAGLSKSPLPTNEQTSTACDENKTPPLRATHEAEVPEPSSITVQPQRVTEDRENTSRNIVQEAAQTNKKEGKYVATRESKQMPKCTRQSLRVAHANKRRIAEANGKNKDEPVPHKKQLLRSSVDLHFPRLISCPRDPLSPSPTESCPPEGQEPRFDHDTENSFTTIVINQPQQHPNTIEGVEAASQRQSSEDTIQNPEYGPGHEIVHLQYGAQSMDKESGLTYRQNLHSNVFEPFLHGIYGIALSALINIDPKTVVEMAFGEDNQIVLDKRSTDLQESVIRYLVTFLTPGDADNFASSIAEGWGV